MTAPLEQIATFVLPDRSDAQLSAGVTALGLRDIRTLSDGLAVEGLTRLAGSSAARDALKAVGILADVCVQSNSNRRKTVLICDMDSTLIGQECIDELADFAGVKARVSEITERAMRGEIGFEGALEERVGLLKGLPVATLQQCFDDRIRLSPGARTLAQTMARNGAKTLIVSGGFTFFSERVAAACGFAAHQANHLNEADGSLTGTVAYPILGREAKYDALVDICGGDTSQSLAIGDGANDLAMIEAAGLGLAYYAKPAVAAASHSAITCTDLRTALYFQGYSDEDIVET